MQENQTVGAEKGEYENIESDFDESELYQIENMSLDDTKEKLEWHERAFECKLKNIYDIEKHNGMNRMHDNEVNNISQ